MSKTISITQEGPANALALNKDYNRVVIAGRNVFKIFSIEEEEFIEIHNLRVGKNLNLNFSCNDVAWNIVDDHILATAATNGAVVVWNLNKPSRSKQDHVFVDHKRTVNKVCFNPVEHNWLISGSQDGTMKTFDLRTKESTKTFISNTESVRDVQFSPHSHLTFASVSENGNVQVWDVRKPDKCVLQFTAHSGPVFACDWHPEMLWLATASRDKTIKVWDMTTKPNLEYTINTIASVGRVKWRPQHRYHISSAALVVDCSINVWDVRRPYIPFAAFTQHKDVATGIAWRGDPNICLSTSRDCTLFQHVFKDATYPAMNANPHALAISSLGHIAFAQKANPNTSRSSKIQGILRRSTTSGDEFWQVSSVLNVFHRIMSKEIDWLIACAEKYVLAGKPLADICEHNAEVARDLGRLSVSLMWMTLKTLYTSRATEYIHQLPSKEDHELEEKLDKAEINGVKKGEEKDEEEKLSRRLEDSLGDFFFGDAEMDPLSMDFEINGLDGLISQDWTLQNEAFPLRHEIQDRSPPPEQFPNDSPDPNDVPNNNFSMADTCLLSVSSQLKLSGWDHGEILARALRKHASMGDLQTPVCVLIALGDKRTSLLNHIDGSEQETWLLAYLDLLSRYKLYIHASQVIKLSWLPSVAQLNQQSTTVYASCGYCNKTLPQGSWICPKCNRAVICCVCHQTVRGLYAWCQGCMHGGHLFHIQEWINDNTYCPTGCGHACEYS